MTFGIGNTEYYEVTVDGETLEESITLNGEQKSASRTVYTLPLDGAKTRFTIDLVYDDGIVDRVEKTYKLTINRSLPVKVKFNVTPETRFVLSRDADDAVLSAARHLQRSAKNMLYSVSAVGYGADRLPSARRRTWRSTSNLSPPRRTRTLTPSFPPSGATSR